MSATFELVICVFSALIFLAHGKSLYLDDEEYDVVTLNKLDIDTTRITVSGFSAGSTMATQMHIAHSSLISGVALFSQAYYRCGPTSLVHFGTACTTYGDDLNTPRYDIWRSFQDAYDYENISIIDPLVNIQNHNVFIWTGARDTLIPLDVAEKNYDLYSEFITNKSQISLNINELAQHEFPSDSVGAPCGTGGDSANNIGNCNYSGAYESLKFILGDDIKKPEGEIKLSSPLQIFDQTQPYLSTAGMASIGFLYIPKACQETKCLLHFHFHGCAEGIKSNESISLDRAESYVMNNGFLQMAEVNNIVMVFPQTIEMGLINNGGCWDFFSYTTPLFATKEGIQIRVIHEMMNQIINGTNAEGDGDGSGSSSTFNVMGYNYVFQSLALLMVAYRMDLTK